MLDKDFSRKFDPARKIAPRADWQKATRALLLRQISSDQAKSAKTGFGDYFSVGLGLMRQRLFQPAVMMFLILGTFLGSSLLVNASFYSLPGSKLYTVKIALEQTQVAFTTDDARKVELNVEFARKRIDELDKIAALPATDTQARTRQVNAALKEFTRNVSSVQSQIGRIASADRTVDLAARVKTLRIAVTVGEHADELAKSVDEDEDENESGGDADVAAVENAIAEAVAAARKISQSAQDLLTADEIVTATTTPEIDAEAESEGEVQGADTETGEGQADPSIPNDLFDSEPDNTEPVASGTAETTEDLIE